MSNLPETGRDSVIAAAMSRLAQPVAVDSAATPAPPTTRTGVGRREYDKALVHRLEQLQNAMGEQNQTVSADPMPSATANTYTFRPSTLVITALASALLGAGLTWHALGGNEAEPLLPPPADTRLSAPPTPAAPTAENIVAPLPPPLKTDEAQARELLEAWRQAWSQRDIEAYLSYYSPDFVPNKGQKRTEWAAERSKNLSSRPQISINVHDVRIEHIAEDRIRLAFLQDYAAGNYRENAQAKTLLLVRQAASWLILGEWQGENQAPVATK